MTLSILGLAFVQIGCPQGPLPANDFTLTSDQDIIYVLPGETAVATLAVQHSTADTEIILGIPFPPGGALGLPADTTMRLSGCTSLAVTSNPCEADLIVSTGPLTEPAILRVRTRARVFGRLSPEAIVDVVVVILPSRDGSQIGTADRIAAGSHHSLALLDDGSVYAWGNNEEGQLGDGTRISRLEPVRVSGLPRPALRIAAGDAHSVALLDDGSVWSWGANDLSQLGVGLEVPAVEVFVTPQRTGQGRSISVPQEIDLANVSEIYVGGDHNIARRANDEILSWGSNERGQLGRNSASRRHSYAEFIASDLVLGDIALGGDHSLILGNDIAVFGFGDNRIDQLPFDFAMFPNPATSILTPVLAGLATGASALGAGLNHSLFIFPDGVLRASGSNSNGQLGDGSHQGSRDPVRTSFPAGVDIVIADGGFAHTLALDSDGLVWGFGNNAFGQLGEADDPLNALDQPIPVAMTALPFTSNEISAGGRHSMAVGGSCGEVWTWGDGVRGQLGHGAPTSPFGRRPSPSPVRGLRDRFGSNCHASVALLTRGGGRISSPGLGLTNVACPEPCVAAHPLDVVVSITATPVPFARFLRWRGDCAGLPNPAVFTVDDDLVCIAEFSPAPMPPVAGFIVVTPEPLGVGRVDFDAAASVDSDGSIVLYEWDFGDDGSFDFDSTTPLSSSLFATPGFRDVRLRVTDDDGQTDEAVITIEIVDPNALGLDVTVQFAGPGVANGFVTLDPGGIILSVQPGPRCDGMRCTVADLIGTISLTPESSGFSFFLGWPPGICDSIDAANTCMITLTQDISILAEFGSEL